MNNHWYFFDFIKIYNFYRCYCTSYIVLQQNQNENVWRKKKYVEEISTCVHLLLKVPKMQLFRLTVKYLIRQINFYFFFFHLKKNVNPGGVDYFPGCYTPKFFNRHIFIQRNIFFILKILSHKVHGVMYLKHWNFF